MKILFPERIIDKHVGGNTTYGRNLESGLHSRGVATGRIPAGRNSVFTAIRETRQGLVKRSAGELIHFLADTGPLIGTRTPSVVTVHGIASRWVSGVRNPRQEAIWRFRVRQAIKNTDRLITVSESSADDIAHTFDVDRDRISVIYHGMDFPEGAPDPGCLDRIMDGSKHRNFALYVGNIEPRKNLVALVRAFDSPQIRSSGLSLIIAGKPAWNSNESMAAIAQAENTTYLGFVSEQQRRALLGMATMFVFPSQYEGFGFPVLEALAAGVPTICSGRGALAEVAGPARVLKEIDQDSIAEEVLAALADEPYRNAVKEDGPEWARRFTWSRSVERHLEVYREALR